MHTTNRIAVLATLLLTVLVASCGGSSTKTTAPTSQSQASGPTSQSKANTSAAAVPESPASSAAAGSGSDGGCEAITFAVLCGTVDIKGASPIKGKGVSQTVSQSCAKYVSNDLFGFDKTPELITPTFFVNNTELVRLSSFVEKYEGPGTFGLDRLVGINGSGFSLSVGNGLYEEATGDNSVTPTGSLTIKADGSGSFTFKDFVNEETKATISGSFAWVCVEPS